MQCSIHFYLLNSDFSEEHADLHHGGEESEFNTLYEWEDELTVTSDVLSIETIPFASYPLQGVDPDGKEFAHDVENMRLFEIIANDGPNFYVGCSESILDSYSKENLDDEMIILKVYLKDYEPMSNPIPGIYIASQEFPKDLIQ